MTKTEQLRVTTWRSKILQHAAAISNVARTCRRFGISRKTFYKWRRRFLEHGDAGLCDRPLTPRGVPRATAGEVVSKIVQTDNGAEFQSHFHWHLEQRDIRHVYIRPRTPHLNGKVERSHRVDDQEFYQLLDTDGIRDNIHLFNEKLREWEDYYNYHRPHAALDGQTPYERLVEKTRTKALPTS
jgi:transposase InsO family protein